MRNLDRQRRRIDDLVAIESSQRAARNIANNVAAGALRAEPHSSQRIHHLGKRFNRQPMQLNILPRSDIGEVPRVLLRELTNHPQLRAGQNAIRQPNAHHEEFSGLAFATDSTGRTHAIALGVNAPPLEVGPSPLRKHRLAAFPRELADLVPGVPGVLCKLQPLGLLGLRLFDSGWCWERSYWASLYLSEEIKN